MSDPLVVRPQNKTLAFATAAGVGALAIGGFTLSFTALRELAVREFAIAAQLAFIYPLVIDGFIVIATAAAFTMKNRGPRVTWYPWAALGVFGALSVLGNAAHAIDNPRATFPEWVSALGASIPAVALLVASHLMVLMIDGKAQRRSRTQSRTKPAPTTVVAPATVTPQPAAAGSDRVGALPAPSPIRSVEAGTKATSLAERVEAAVADGHAITAALIADLERVSERTGRRRLAELREQRPDLFAAHDEAVA